MQLLLLSSSVEHLNPFCKHANTWQADVCPAVLYNEMWVMHRLWDNSQICISTSNTNTSHKQLQQLQSFHRWVQRKKKGLIILACKHKGTNTANTRQTPVWAPAAHMHTSMQYGDTINTISPNVWLLWSIMQHLLVTKVGRFSAWLDLRLRTHL